MHAFAGTAGATRTPRRLVPALIGVAAMIVTLLSTAVTPSPAQAADPATRGLFGSQDPTYDGVYRQSYALLGLAAINAAPPRVTLRWLLDQQCADGSFVSYRADLSAPCPPPDAQSYTGPDTNSTALAIVALTEHGRLPAARKAAAWLLRIQLPGGGWGYVEGSPADSTSTALALEALESVPGTAKQQRAAVRWLSRQIAPCDAPAGQRFGVRYQPGALPDGISTSQGLLALSGAFPVTPKVQRAAMPKVTCDSRGKPTDPRAAVTRWVASTIMANAGSIPDPFTPDQADWNSTALGVIGMVATRTSGRATALALAALQANAEAYVSDGTSDRPAALGTLLLVSRATGADATDFGGIDLAMRLLDTIQE